jgi:hypothetical protein
MPPLDIGLSAPGYSSSMASALTVLIALDEYIQRSFWRNFKKRTVSLIGKTYRCINGVRRDISYWHEIAKVLENTSFCQ